MENCATDAVTIRMKRKWGFKSCCFRVKSSGDRLGLNPLGNKGSLKMLVKKLGSSLDHGVLKYGGCTTAENNVITGFIKSLVLNTLIY